eukprot:7376041-Prymnesium_polylepis.2
MRGFGAPGALYFSLPRFEGFWRHRLRPGVCARQLQRLPPCGHIAAHRAGVISPYLSPSRVRAAQLRGRDQRRRAARVPAQPAPVLELPRHRRRLQLGAALWLAHRLLVRRRRDHVRASAPCCLLLASGPAALACCAAVARSETAA